jgi:hypothetical protein
VAAKALVLNTGPYTKGDIKKAFEAAGSLLKKNAGKNPVPYELETTLQAINSKIDKAARAGDNKVVYAYSKAKEMIEEKLRSIPEGISFREGYAKHSKGVNEFTENNLIAPIIERDQWNKKFILPAEKVPKKLLMGSKRDQREFVSKIKDDPEAFNATKSTFVDNLLKNIEQGSVDSFGNPKLSNIKSNKFLKENKGLAKSLFNKKELRDLNDVNNVLSRRQLISDAQRAIGSNTVADTTLLKYLGQEALHKIPGATTAGKYFSNKTLGGVNEGLKKSLLDPEYARYLLQTEFKKPSTNYYGAPSIAHILSNINNND